MGQTKISFPILEIELLYHLEQGKRRKSLYIWKQKENDKSFLVFDKLTIDFLHKHMIINARYLSNASYQISCKF